MKIALSAGHHEKSKGAINKKLNLNEFDEASKVIPHLKEKLEKAGHDVEIITGKLSSKVTQINAGNFDLALDIHFNADADHLDPEDFDDSRGHGSMVMYCPKADSYQHPEPNSERREQADAFSFSMHSYLGNRDLGGRAGWYWGSNPPESKDFFLRRTHCMAFIPEPGYIDNNAFARKWLESGKHDQIAEAILYGIEAVIGD